MKKRLILLAKILVASAVIGGIAWEVHRRWGEITGASIHIDWRFAPLGVLGFAGVFLSSGIVWLWMARRMGDRTPALYLLGAYVFSQMGKYVPGKVFLLLLRIERTSRAGMAPGICIIATLLENAMYMLSGGLVAAVTLAIYLRDQPGYLMGTLGVVALLAAAFHPAIFYRVINKGLTTLKRAPLDPAHRLPVRDLLLAVLLFLPCWAFGGLAVWASCRCIIVHLPAQTAIALPGAFSASVIGGMAMPFAPGGLGLREAILAAILNSVLAVNVVPILAVVGLQRLLQITAEVTLGLAGALLTNRKPRPSPARSEPAPDSYLGGRPIDP